MKQYTVTWYSIKTKVSTPPYTYELEPRQNLFVTKETADDFASRKIAAITELALPTDFKPIVKEEKV